MKTWVVRLTFFLVAFMFLVLAVGGRSRADRALDRANEVRSRGVPSEINLAAAHLVSVWAGQPASVVTIERLPNELWHATAMVGPDCYEVVVGSHGENVSAHPGLIPCPSVAVAGVDSDKLESGDERYTLVSLFLDSWLKGDPTASRFLADSTVAIPPPGELATDVKVMSAYADDVTVVEGAKSTVTVEANVELPGRTEALAWTFHLTRGPSRWSIAGADGGEVPTGDPTDLRLGRTPSTTIPNEGVQP